MKHAWSLALGDARAPRAAMAFALFAGLLASVALVTAADSTPSPSLDRACEMVLDGATCRQRCECEWCPPGPDHGCHTINLAGACGGEPGQRAPHDACYDDPASGVEGLVVGGLFVGLALVAVGIWWGCLCVRSVRHHFLRHADRVNAVDDEKGTARDDMGAGLPLDETPDRAPRDDGPGAAPPPRRLASRPIDMPRPRVPIL